MPFIRRHVRRRRGWEIPEKFATPEHVYLNRRKFIAALGLGAIGGAIGAFDATAAEPASNALDPSMFGPVPLPPSRVDLLKAKRNPAYAVDRGVTVENVANHYNNFYEFGLKKSTVAKRAAKYKTAPWTIQVGGLVEKPLTLDFDELIKTMPVEERVYKHRCVEAWSMAVPWMGFPFKALIDKVGVKSGAKFVRLESANKPDEMPGIEELDTYPWPYFEGLSMAEATNELALLVVGVFGHPLPNSHGAPIRLALPWKYGFKSAKAIVKIDFVETEPETFWHKIAPLEYGFVANIDPEKPHPRWSQAMETVIGVDERIKTVKYNGYGEYVGKLYE